MKHRLAILTAGLAGVLVCSLLLVGAGSPQHDDSLGPDLRARVERLKVEAPETSTDLEVLSARLATLWEWANAYALAGGVIPVDLPYDYGICMGALRGREWKLPAPSYAQALVGRDGRISLEKVSRLIADYTRELQIKDERPDAIGPLTLSEEGPFVVRSYRTLELTYTVGEMAMAAGGGVLVANNLMTRFQSSDPKADNYVTARCSNPKARLERSEPWGEWTTFITRPAAAFRLVAGSLQPGDTITVVLGDTSGGSKGLLAQLASVDRVVAQLYVDLEGAGNMLAPAWPSWSLVGEPEPALVNAVAPSIVAPGEPFRLAVRFEDRFKNPVGSDAPAFKVELGGVLFASAPPGDGPVTVVDGLRLEQPGVYRFDIQSEDGSLTGRSNPMVVRAKPDHRVFWGDTHGHSGLADGEGNPDGYFRFARDVARLDFVTLSEHDIWTDASEWRLLQAKTEQYLAPGAFTTFLGYEWTALTEIGGHHNVYFRTTEGRQRVSVQQGIDLPLLYDGLRKVHKVEDVLIIPHAHMPGDWRQNDAAMERVVEVQSGHGTFEFFGNRYLQNGFRVGFVGSSDNHLGHPGYSPGSSSQLGGLAAVMAASNAREALFAALRDRRCYATTGERILVEAALDGVLMGRRVDPADRRTLTCRVHGTEPIEAVDVVKNGRVVYSKRYLTPRLATQESVMVRFGSSTEVESYTVPRQGRAWRGAIEVRGARLIGFSPPWFYHPVTDDYQLDPADGNRILFSTATRGRSKGVLLELDDVTADSEVVVRLDAVRGVGRTAGGSRIPPVPAAEMVFRVGDLVDGPALHELREGEGVDTVDAQLVPPDAAVDQEFDFTDTSETKPGDYYYLRVRQVDGSMAWSSPWLIAAE